MRVKPQAGPRGRPRRFDARRQVLLEQAAAIFAESGYCGATMHDLAARLGVTRPALYHYAPSKEALFEQCVAMAEATLNAAVVSALGAPNGRGQVSVFFKRYAEFRGGDLGCCFAATDLRQVSAAAREMIEAARQRLVRAVAGMLRRGVADGSVCECDAVETSRLLFAAFDAAGPPHGVTRPGAHAVFADTVLGLMFNGLATRMETSEDIGVALQLAPH